MVTDQGHQDGCVCHDCPSANTPSTEAERNAVDTPYVPPDRDHGVDAVLAAIRDTAPAESEADEAAGRVAAYVGALPEPSGGPAWDKGENVARWGEHYLYASDLRLLLADRDQWRNRAFRAARLAMEPEEGAVVQFGLENAEGDAWSVSGHKDDAAVARHIASREGLTAVRRVVGPWKPMPAPESPGGEPK